MRVMRASAGVTANENVTASAANAARAAMGMKASPIRFIAGEYITRADRAQSGGHARDAGLSLHEADRLDPVTIMVADEGRVIAALPVVGAQSRRAVGRAPVRERGGMEGVD